MKQSIDNILPAFLLDPKYRIWRHILMQILILSITINIFWDTPDEFIATRERIYAWIVYFTIINLLVYVSAYVLVPRFLLKNSYLLYIVVAFAVILFSILLIVFLQGVLFEPTITGRPEPEAGTQNETFTHVMMGIGAASSIVGIGLIIAGVSAFLLFRHWIQQNQRISELESETLQSELNFLKSQINPHFLFNMLNNANIMVDEDPETASHILIKLDDLLNYQFNDSTQDKVYLKNEILFLTDFLGLEKTRRDNFEYTLTEKGNIENVEVPPLLFIPFIENAVKHNTDGNNNSYVYTIFKIEGTSLTFICENSKPLNPVKKKVGGLGLANIRRRLDLLFGKDYSLELEDTESSYKVILKLKLNQSYIKNSK